MVIDRDGCGCRVVSLPSRMMFIIDRAPFTLALARSADKRLAAWHKSPRPRLAARAFPTTDPPRRNDLTDIRPRIALW